MACVVARLGNAVPKRFKFLRSFNIRTFHGTSTTQSNQSSDGDPSDPSSPQPKASSRLPQTTRGPRRKKVDEAVQERKYFSPEFMPPSGQRSKLKDYLERQDCYSRRKVIDLPEFYPGSILAVTVSDPYARGKESRFVGICIERKNYGLGASFKLRNIIDEQGIEINYEMYNPLIKKIEVMKLEKRLDEHLLYLRDALPEYSMIDPDMVMIKHPPNKPVPVNDVKVKMKPRPWHKRWERFELQGIDMTDVLTEDRIEEGKTWWKPEFKRMDLLGMYPSGPHTDKDRQNIRKEVEKHGQDLKQIKGKLKGGS